MDIVLIAASYADGRAHVARMPRHSGQVVLVYPGNVSALRARRAFTVVTTDAAEALPAVDLQALVDAASEATRWMDAFGNRVA